MLQPVFLVLKLEPLALSLCLLISVTLSNLAHRHPPASPLVFGFCQPWWRGATSKQHSSPLSALIISGSHLLGAPLQAVSTLLGLWRAGLLQLRCPIPYAVCCPAQHNRTKNIPLGHESDLLGGFNHLPLLDFSTFTATKHAGPKVQRDLKTSPSSDFQKLEPLHCCNSLRSADRALLKPRWATQPLPHQCQPLGHLLQEKQPQGVQAGKASKGAELLV